MGRVRLISLTLLLVWLATFLRPVQAQPEPLSLASGATYAFGQMIEFHLTAAADVETTVNNVTLFFRAREFSHTFTVDDVAFSQEPFAAHHRVDLTQLRLAPFTEIVYWWQVTTVDGERVRLPEQTLLYEDDQFNWQQVRESGVTVHWVGDDPALGQLALDIVAETRPRLQAVAPVAPASETAEFNLYLYPTAADLRAALRLTGRDWVGAHAHPELGVLLVTAVNSRTAASDLRQAIPHEMAHFFLYQVTGPNYDRIPAWFNEGLATYMEATRNPGYRLLLETAVDNRTTIPFSEVCHAFPAGEDRALLAYAQSVSLIEYIQATYGNGALNRLVDAFADGADCHSAVERVLQMSLEELNRNWLQALAPRTPLAQFWHKNGLWLILLLGSFAVTSLLFFLPHRVG